MVSQMVASALLSSCCGVALIFQVAARLLLWYSKWSGAIYFLRLGVFSNRGVFVF